ncbi:YdeI/OmpD-associated family protein [Mucilaginibacter sp. CSA2-8R]|uniref:YdeI/OmpD-associated family protein n=1 Tax=Mucilaginibacter sp. CSA2-8R TaxID=3141542 RepID=UPI00315D7372
MNAVAKKLLMKPGQSWLLYNAPENYLNTLAPLPDNLQISYAPKGQFDGIQLFTLNRAELVANLKQIQPVLQPNTVLWIVYPKKSSGIASDLAMMSSWDEVTPYGLTGVAAAAIDATWTALRFRPIEHSNISATRNSEIEKNNYAAYVDIINKKVTLPTQMAVELAKTPLALTNFEKLSYSNQKEYVLWVLTAKQDKTRIDRITKTIEKLLDGKKNPSDK